MNNKTTIIATLTFLVGCVSGYFLGKSYSEKIYREKYQKESVALREYFNTKDNDINEETENESEEGEENEETKEVDPEEVEALKNVVDQFGYLKKNPGKSPRINYSNQQFLERVKKQYKELYKQNTDEDEDYDSVEVGPDEDEYEEDESFEEAQIRLNEEHKKNIEPYLITSTAYEEGVEGYGKQALYYYSKDRVLCEDDDTAIAMDDEEEIVGFDYEDVLDVQTTAWVRNDRLSMLYEIHLIPMSYRDKVMNAIETPMERKLRIQGRRKMAMDN